MATVTLQQLTKTYGKEKTLAVDQVSFSVAAGELFGLIGPDGAGKTSLFRMLTTLLLPDAGSATVAGFDVVRDYRQIRRTVGYMPGKFSLYPDLTIQENLNFFATVFGTTIAENYDPAGLVDMLRQRLSNVPVFASTPVPMLSSPSPYWAMPAAARAGARLAT